jgi:hypothetical protein
MTTPPSHSPTLRLRRRLAAMRPGRTTAFASAVAIAIAVGANQIGPSTELRVASAHDAAAHAGGAGVAPPAGRDALTRATASARDELRADWRPRNAD